MLSNENIQSKDTDGVKRKEGKGMERKLDKLYCLVGLLIGKN